MLPERCFRYRAASVNPPTSECHPAVLVAARVSPLDPLPALANGGYTEMKEGHKPTEQAEVDCQNDFFLSCDCSVGVMRLCGDFSAKSKDKVGNRAVDLWHRERGIYDLDR
jgi:hypothetical protein